MTKHTNFPTPGTESENVVTFPNNSDALHPEEHPASDGHMPDGMPDGFLLRDDGIYQLRPGDDEDLEPVKICSPLIVKGQCRRPSGGGWGRVVEIQNPDGGWHELILEARDISAGPAKIVTPLSDRGLMVTNAAKAAQSVKELLNAWQPAARYDRVNHLGWVDGEFSAFTLGDGRVIGDALVVPDHGANHVAAAMHAKGTLEEWRATVAAPCSGNPLMIFALSLAFSGPLLSVLGREGGGFHLRGDTSKGKSTLQRLAASVWGAPEFMQDWRTTDNVLCRENLAA
ncbi:MAG: DUF927 domain-containing protein [Sediminimonas qiaohouensis]|uniref:DUF927 domain-containing protein n=1 Tax=Sediminimonas qiaohouensis TaxID=552061 RepID=A0A7C9HLM9_9RHOB|nr:DUF927 domain-containing protein [Sediminimonas qiaohouensis]MTJ03983.1 DUF927 domain-containing protein [Sediminimonas qiaohouensis]